jgi:hypothetical protein
MKEAKMKHVVLIALAGIALGGLAADETAPLSAETQAELDQRLAGRTAGPAVNCVRKPDVLGTRSIGDEVLLFETRGGILWVNRPPGGCPGLDSGRTLVSIAPSTQFCRGDIVNVVDPVGGFSYGGCGLGEFVPWRRNRSGG